MDLKSGSTSKRAPLTRPAKPSGVAVDSDDLEIYKHHLKSWSEKKKSALKKIPEKIIQTIDKSCFNFIDL